METATSIQKKKKNNLDIPLPTVPLATLLMNNSYMPTSAIMKRFPINFKTQ